ncbi:MAG: leucine-rich repeat protein, partial [Ruminococcus sp.]|nr:leucine-rich repeat protein [Ruminococcus sp.]
VEPVEGSFESIISELGDNMFVTIFNNLTQTYMFAITEETEADYKLLYTVEQDGTATITGYEGVAETLVIPSEIDGYPVSKIDVQAFATSGEELYNDENSYCSVETLIIEEGVTEIELEAFLNCKNLKSVTLPNTLDYVWDVAFCGCDSLKEIKNPSGTGRICEAAFGYKYECNYVDGVYDYEAWTEKMDDFTIYGEVDSIAETYANENGFTFIALDDTSSGAISNLLTWEISSDYNTLLVTVGDGYTMTFQDNTCYVDGTVIETISSWNIEELDAEENQEFIEWLSEFELNEIIFSDNVTEIIDTFNIYLFNQAEKITFGENVAIIGDGVFYSSEASDIVFPDSLIEIGDNAFENCTNLSSIILPKNINSVGESAFHACSSLLDVTVLSQNADLADHCFGYSNQIEPLENMIIRGYAGSTAETYANENGFTFIALDDVTTETNTFTLGDVDENNVIDAIDASYVLTEYAKKATSQASGFTESQELAADVNGDSIVDAIDASFILSYYAYTAVGGTDSFEDYMTTH